MTTIGFSGLGHMGGAMSRNLLKHKHPLYVYDLLPEAITPLEKAGAKAAKSPEELARLSDVIVTMLPAGKDVKATCLGEHGIFNHAKKGTLIIDSSSIEIGISRELEAQAKAKGLAMIDAPVSGGMAGAKAGMLTFMVGGAHEDYLRAKPILECMGKAIIYAGGAGNGQVAKICNNMILGVSMIAVSEAFLLAKKLGLDPQTFFNISSLSSGQCWSMTNYCPMPGPVANAPSNNNYQPGFAAAMMLKDLNLSQDAAQHAKIATPLGAEATALYTLFNNLGFGEMDFSGIIKMIEGKTS